MVEFLQNREEKAAIQSNLGDALRVLGMCRLDQKGLVHLKEAKEVLLESLCAKHDCHTSGKAKTSENLALLEFFRALHPITTDRRIPLILRLSN